MKKVFNRKGGGKRRTKRKTCSKRQRGGNPDEQDKKDKSLFNAISIHDYDKVEEALNNGANVNALNNKGDTPLRHAIKLEDEDIDMVELLLYHEDMDIVLDLETNTELALAENRTPYGEDQNGIPYMIEDYIVTKNQIKKHRYKNIKQLQHSINRKAEESC